MTDDAKETQPAPPIEQLAQQQKAEPIPVHFVDISSTVFVHGDYGLSIYTSAIDDTGAMWERWSFWERGRWEEIDRPTR